MQNMKVIILILALSLFSFPSFAMEDDPDYLIIENDTVEIWDFPLDSFFSNDKRPDFLCADDPVDIKYNLKTYSAYWRLINDKLFLDKITVANKIIRLSRIFTDKHDNSRIFADWYNGSILTKSGKTIGIYQEFETEYVFDNGVMTQKRIDKYSIRKESIYQTEPRVLLDYIQQNIDYSNIERPTRNSKVFVKILSVTKTGRISRVEIIRGLDEKMNQEALRVVKSIPEWTVTYKNDKLFDVGWVVPVTFLKKE